MTIFKARETRAGKKISKKNLQALANAHHSIKAIADDAGVDLDDIPPAGTLAGPTGDASTPTAAGLGNSDATRTRIAGHPAGPTTRIGNQSIEVRG